MKEYDSDRVEHVLSTMYKNYYAQMCELDNKETKNIKNATVGAGLYGGFDHTSELKVMKFKEAVNRPDRNKWKGEIKNKHKRMVTSGVWEPLDKKDFPDGVNVTTSTWACKKKKQQFIPWYTQ